MFTTQQCILMNLLNCGSADLSLLDDINYDLDDILDELVDNQCLSLNNLLEGVFQKGICELTEVVKTERNEILNDLNYIISFLPYSTASEAEIDEFDRNITEEQLSAINMYGGFEWKEDAESFMEEVEELDPEKDVDYFCNCLDTHIRFVNHKDVYRKCFASVIEEIENDMGFEFY